MKKWLMIIAALAVVGVIAALLIFKFYINKPHEDIEAATPAYTIATGDLWKQYTSDLKQSDSLYTGKVIELNGNLSRADISDSLAFAVFVMEADSMFGDKSVRCEMLQKYAADLKSIAPGTTVKIKGFCNGFDQTDVKFSKCSIVK